MKIHRVLFFCFLSALCDGNTGLVEAETFVRTEGSSIIVECPFSIFGRKWFLCKDECKKEDILIETDADRAQNGRYIILYKPGTFPVSSTILYVGITQLTKSDSGRYRCGLERRFLPDSYWEFNIIVTHAPKTFTEAMKQPEQQQTEETTASATVHSVKVTAPKTFTETTKQPEQQQTEETTAAATAHSVKGYTLSLVVWVTVVVLLAVVVLLLYKRKTGLNTRGPSADRNMEFTTREKCEDYTSPSVDETTRDEDKIYCNETSSDDDKIYCNI